MKLTGVAEKKLALRILAIKRQSKQRKLEERPNISLQGYRPDTCGCYVIECIDGEKPRGELDHMAFQCPAHSMITEDECFEAIVGSRAEGQDPSTIDSEQRRKNSFIRLATERSDDVGRWNEQRTNEVDPVTNKWIVKRSRVPRDDIDFVIKFTGEGRHRKMRVAVVGVHLQDDGVQQVLAELPGDNELDTHANVVR